MITSESITSGDKERYSGNGTSSEAFSTGESGDGASQGKQHTKWQRNGRDTQVRDTRLFENIPDELKRYPQWVCFRFGPRKANGKRDKIPLDPRTGEYAATDNPQTWATYDVTVLAYASETGDGIGFVFTEDDPFTGVDLDGCRDPLTGTLTPFASDILQQLDSYSEASPSGKGFHGIVKATLPGTGGKRDLIEMYDRGRFFTFTGEHLGGTPTTIEDRRSVIEALYHEHFEKDRTKKSGEQQQKKKTATQPLSEAEIARILDALLYILAVDYEIWLRVGMALHHAFTGSAQGYQIWLEWSRTCPEKFDELECKRKWNSFYGEGITLGTLFEYALRGGWTDSNGPKGRCNLTELGNAERFIRQHKDSVRYCNLWKEWVLWDGQRWKSDKTQVVKTLGRDTIRAIYAEAAEEIDSDQRKKIAAHALKSENDKAIKGTLSLAQMYVPVLPEQFDSNPWLLNVANGTIDLTTGTLGPHRKTDLLSKITPIIYDPDASAILWEEFLEKIFSGNQELIDWLQRAIGYSLTGLIREQCFFLCHGVGANGKSTFLNTIMALLGDYSEQATFQTFLSTKSEAVRNDLAKLHTCRFVAAIEAEEGRKLSEVVIKQLTGGDPVTARFLFSEYFTYIPQFKIWLATNHKPTISGTDHGIWRRVKLIPFDVVIPDEEQDESLPERLKAELPGILAWAVRGCLEWQKRKLKPEPEIVQMATKNYREEEDVLERFISEQCVRGPSFTAPSSRFHRQFVAWCKLNAEQEISQTALAQRMKNKGYSNQRNSINGLKQWQGIALLKEDM